jgi:hypothetical protein
MASRVGIVIGPQSGDDRDLVWGAVSVFVRGPPRPRPKRIWALSRYLLGGTA